VPNANIFTSSIPRVGDVVSFSYERHARKDGPYNPKIVRIRTDILWEDVVLNSNPLIEKGSKINPNYALQTILIIS
jgi:hypothetical protein